MDHTFVDLTHEKTTFISPDPPLDWRVKVGTLWSDTSANLHKRCTSTSPLTFVSTEGGGGGGAPTDAEYLVGAVHASLTAERVVTNTATVAWDLITAGQAKANVQVDSISNAILSDMAANTVKARGGTIGDPSDFTIPANTVLGRKAADLVAETISTTQIADDQITYAKIQNVTDARLLGRSAGSAGDCQEITVGSGLSLSAGSLTSIGDAVLVNGSATTDANFNDTNPAAPAGSWLVGVQSTGSGPTDVSSYISYTSSHADAFRRKPFFLSCDWHTRNVSGNPPFIGTIISAGTNNDPTAGVVTNNHPGIVRIVSSTTANSGVGWRTDANFILIGGGEGYELIFRLDVLTNLSLRFGYLDTATSADATDGCYFELTGGTGNIIGKTANNSTRSSTATIHTGVINTWYRCRLFLNSGATLVTFEVRNDSGTHLGSSPLTLSTNIPTTRETASGLICTHGGSVVTSLAQFDYQAIWLNDRALTR